MNPTATVIIYIYENKNADVKITGEGSLDHLIAGASAFISNIASQAEVPREEVLLAIATCAHRVAKELKT